MINLSIPTTAFAPGGPLEGKDPAECSLAIPLQNGGQENITAGGKTYEDWQFHPGSAGDYNDMLRMVNIGLLQITLAGVAQTPAQLITLFKSFYQEL